MAKRKIRPMDDFKEKPEELGAAEAKSRDIREEEKKRPSGARKVREPPVVPPGAPGPGYGEMPFEEPVKQTNKPRYAGIILIIAGLLTFYPTYVFFSVTQDDFMGELIKRGENMTVSGVVYDENFEPVENVSIEIYNTGLNATTDSTGGFILRDVPLGKRQIIVEKEDYQTIEHRVYLEGNVLEPQNENELKITFTLTPGNGTVTTGDYESENFKTIQSFLRICGVIATISAILGIVGGYLALKRTKFYIVLAGGILIIFFGISLIIPSILAIVAIILVSLSRKEFS
ncbi:MAG: carboxypeptidase regulatory-like domain-containing protein [Thermoplasmata archaeon]|nr:MAG: carboxypeptidase regulatory-like domain-containing protein [Thermoplasmata archaeon]